MSDELMDALAKAVEGKVCGVSGCQTDPIAERNGRALCARHRDQYDYSSMGEPCDRCGSRHWVATPDAKSVATCAHCEYASYDDVLKNSW